MNSSQEGLAGEDRIQSYPSPDAESQQETVPFFNHDNTDRDAHQGDGSQAQHPGPHTASVEELQLAAQLGQDLASEPMMPVTDPNLKFDESSLRSIMPHPDDSGIRNVIPHPEEPNMRHVMPHPDEHPSQAYQETVAPPPPVPAMAVTQVQIPLGHGISQPFSNASDDATPPRKRSKVSRACDECRRKKVKCDAQSDTGDTPCSNCRRSSQHCSFSRIPQKRGPSKGYIKELADRINSIEGRLGENAGFQSPGSAEEHNRKRAFSSISSGELHAPTAPRPNNLAWGPDQRPQTQQSSASERHGLGYQANGLAPQPAEPRIDTPSKPPVVDLETPSMDLPDLSQPRIVDDDLFQGYLSLIHPYIPILPTTKARLQVYLAQCSGILREAFLEALAATLQSFPNFTAGPTGDAALARKMLVEWELNDDVPHTHAAHIVHLQTLILLLIDSDARPSTSASTQKESLLGRAVGTAWALRLHHIRVDLHDDDAMDADSDVHIQIRLWWSLVTLDRWNALSTGTPTMTQKGSSVAQSGLSAIVGETSWLLIRLSKVMERASAVISTIQQPLVGHSRNQMLADFLDDYIETFREDLPSHIDPLTHPVVHLTYWHCRLLAYLLNPSSRPADVIWPCRELVALLTALPHLRSPFHHHFQALCMLVLAELSRLDKTAEEATKLLAEMQSIQMSPVAWGSIVANMVGQLLRQTTDGQGLLLHLADSASSSVALGNQKQGELDSITTADEYLALGFDPRPLLTAGYFKFIWASHVDT